MHLRLPDRTLSLDRAVVMGVLNVTPDSFSDGGLWFDSNAAIEHALEMEREGAGIIDIGGESTRPDADPVAETEELRRVLPVIEALKRRLSVPLSIDTRKPLVALRAVEAGVDIVNDTNGEETDWKMAEVAAQADAGFVFMHTRGTPATMRSLAHYEDVVAHVRSFLADAAIEIERRGIARDSIVLDPGFGFAKDPDQNLELLRRLDEIVSLGLPVLVGTSRKSFIGAVLGLAEHERVEGTISTVVSAVEKGARIVRVHDVQPVVRAVRMIEAVLGR
ncbi:MAG: dihydropteroate synthase [Actinomycetota bacterium]